MDALRVTVQKTYESKKVLGDYDVDKMLNKAVAHVSTKNLAMPLVNWNAPSIRHWTN